jgi:hypothetical protein
MGQTRAERMPQFMVGTAAIKMCFDYRFIQWRHFNYRYVGYVTFEMYDYLWTVNWKGYWVAGRSVNVGLLRHLPRKTEADHEKLKSEWHRGGEPLGLVSSLAQTSVGTRDYRVYLTLWRRNYIAGGTLKTPRI